MDQVPQLSALKVSKPKPRFEPMSFADNRLADKAGWDKSVLAIELQHLMTIDKLRRGRYRF